MKPWKVVSFHTDDVLYRWHIERLKASLVEFGIDSYIEEIPHRNDWVNHVNYKPVFILKCLDMFDENIVWLDADAVVKQYPVLFDDIDADIAIHYRDNREVLPGTTYIGNTEGGKRLVQDWIAETGKGKGNRHQTDQTTLAEILRAKKYNLFKLPAPYTLIFDLMKHQGPPVIEHFQASRKGRTR